MYKVILKKGEDRRILRGHPWIYANEVQKVVGHDVQGSIARVEDSVGNFVGLGYINHASKILVRMLTLEEEDINRDFFYKRIKRANDNRLQLGYLDNYRAVFAESDLLPALIVDKYGDYLSVQFLSLGMEVRKQQIVDILVEIFQPKGIYERSDVAVREKEGLPLTKGILYGDVPVPVVIVENGLEIEVDIIGGQKTGYYLDQKENRAILEHYVSGKKVLDCFSNIGGFSLCASRYGAAEVTALDISPFAIRSLQQNATRNGLTNITGVTCNVFDMLREYRAKGETFDVIILDPPAFIKSSDKIKEGVKGYRDINTVAMKLLNPNGILVTCSCSNHLSIKLFTDMLEESVQFAGCRAQLVELRTQGKDHPSLVGTDEALYLKCAVLRKL